MVFLKAGSSDLLLWLVKSVGIAIDLDRSFVRSGMSISEMRAELKCPVVFVDGRSNPSNTFPASTL